MPRELSRFEEPLSLVRIDEYGRMIDPSLTEEQIRRLEAHDRALDEYDRTGDKTELAALRIVPLDVLSPAQRVVALKRREELRAEGLVWE